MMGRWQSGAPLALSPFRDDPDLFADRRRNNDFLYAEDDSIGYKPLSVRMSGGRTRRPPSLPAPSSAQPRAS